MDELLKTLPEQVEAVEVCEVTSDALQNFSEASGDPNPIHLNDEAAQAVGLPGRIAHGMYVAGLIYPRVKKFETEVLQGKFELKRLQTRFHAMTFLKEKILVKAGKKTINADKIIYMFYATNPEGEIKVSVNAEFRS